MRGACGLVAVVIASACLLSEAGGGRSGGLVARHIFGQRHAQVQWGGDSAADNLERRGKGRFLSALGGRQLSILHISDAHISLHDDLAPLSTRMHSAFARTTDKVSHHRTNPGEEFLRLLKLACAKQVDLIALGGDIINFPSEEMVAWVVKTLKEEACGIPFVYTAGNHDWHAEGLPDDDTFDAQRLPQLQSTLKPIYDASAAPLASPLYSATELNGVEVLTLDNSNHQINAEQLEFSRQRLARTAGPVVLLMHMPLALPGVDLLPKECCGHPDWGAQTDELFKTEGRPRWPEGNLPSTTAFMMLVRQQAAPVGRIVAVLTGHVHRDFGTELFDKTSAANVTALACDVKSNGCSLRMSAPGWSQERSHHSSSFLYGGASTTAALAEVLQSGSAVGDKDTLMEAEGAVQYTTLDAAEGGYRLLTVHLPDVK